MTAATDTTLEPIRLAVALTHCLPDCSVEMTTDAGERLVVGFGADATISPCLACSAVAAAMRTSPAQLGPLLGLAPGCPRARLLDEEICDSHVGLGVYRYSDDRRWGYVFATLVTSARVRRIVEALSAERLVGAAASQRRLVGAGEWRLSHDDGLAVTICSSSYKIGAASLVAEAEQLALDVTRACLVAELVGEA